MAGGGAVVSRHTAATEGSAPWSLCAMGRLPGSPTCVDDSTGEKPPKDHGIRGFGFVWVFYERRAGELTQRKSSLGEEQEEDKGRMLWLCWFSYMLL